MKECRGYPILGLPRHSANTSEFNKDIRGKDGLQPRCRNCQRQWNARDNPKTNSDPKYDEIRAKCGKKAQRARFTAQPRYIRSNTKERKAHQAIRRKREDLNRACGEKRWAVDHIIPIGKRTHSKGICGLDVPWNMEIIPYCTNAHKSDYLDWNRVIKKG